MSSSALSSSGLSRLLLAASLTLLTASTAPAELLISVGSGTIAPDGNLQLDIGIGSSTPPQGLAEFTLILEITPLTASGDSSLRFVDPQSEAFLDEADYVFASTSDSIAADISPVVELAPQEVTLEDFSLDEDFFPINVPVTGGQLLASVDLAHDLGSQGLTDVGGDQFQVSVAPASFFAEGTFGDELTYSSTPGTVTVAAIPEPSLAGLLLLGGCALAWPRRR
jgi:hypothetical protein